MDEVFQKWCDKLLDTGKGNRLINYKDSKQRTIDVLVPECKDIFKKISSGQTLSFYDVDEMIRNLKDSEIFDDDSGKSQYDKISKEQILNMVCPVIKNNEVLSFKKGFSLRKILGNIKKIATTSLTEKGVNILYMAFGFLCWKESEEASPILKSPLLLIPITIENESSTQPFTVRSYEDEITTNPTLLYKMKHEYEVDLPVFQDDEHPEEQFEEYLQRVQLVADKQNWGVTRDVAIGTFSFLKINMYQDLVENESQILNNPTVRDLLNKTSNQEVDYIDVEQIETENKNLELHNVVDADSSQMSAIIQAKKGKSFVLQGPPGTGKSQTITNLIAEFLYDGKKVLFVSEKLAALNVVYNNLRKAGLSDFCLELHSNKTNKKDVINELYKVLSGNKKTIRSNAGQELEELQKVKTQLDQYAETMHSVQPVIDKTPYQIVNAVSKFKKYPSFEYAIKAIENKDLEYLKSATVCFELLEKYNDEFGYDFKQNCWYGYVDDVLTYENKLRTKNLFKNCVKFLSEISKNLNTLKDETQLEFDSINSIKQNLELLKTIENLKFFDPIIFEVEKLSNLYNLVKNYNNDVEDLEYSKRELNKVFNNDIFELEIKNYYKRFKYGYASAFRFFNKSYRQDKRVLFSLRKDNKRKLSYNEIVKYLSLAKDIQENEIKILDSKKAILAVLTNKNVDNLNFKNLENELNKLNKVLLTDLLPLTTIDANQFKNCQAKIHSFVEFINSSASGLEDIQELQKSFNEEIFNLKSTKIEDVITKISDCLTGFDEIENWVRFNENLNEIKNLALLEFVELSIKNNIPRATLSKTFKAMFYTQWMYYIINNNEILHEFSRMSQDSAVKEFKKKDKLRFEISKAEIVTKLNATMPTLNNLATGSQVSLLVREANKKTRQKPVRILLRDIGQTVQKLKPCFLMSPLSVSTYLDSDTCKFDVVIFDEASQIFPWDAVGSIYRANQIIVVGDSKQMPPTNFFNAGIIEDELDEEMADDDVLDFESILDLCSAILPQNRLNWHYRSKTEDLIAFSNQNFYGGHLVTFPSAHKNNDDMGVEFYYVENGIFDRKSKCNLTEAERVVDLVFEHFKTHPNRSLGVVAFSISQQDAIEEIIQQRRAQNDQYALFFDSKRPEPFFVKNLETVQGDERDTIIFSVAYAKGSDGRFLHNFGPLNNKGGERRLNVAITRAKYNVKLVSSIRSYDINLEKSNATGVKLLKEYLYCAEHGMQNANKNLIVNPDAEVESYFEQEVYNVLLDAGYVVDKQVGCSDYRIDLGVKHPTKSDYVLAVECDGATYHSGKTTRDRDRLRQEVLERLGWKFYRIWSTDWFRNTATEKQKLLLAVQKSIDEFDKDNKVKTDFVINKDSQPISFIEETKVEKKDLKTLFKKFEYFDIYKNRNSSIANTLIALISQEQPIHHEQLLKEVVVLFGREKVTNAFRLEFENVLSKCKDVVFKIGDFYYADKNLDVEMRVPKYGDIPRNITLISDKEIENGMFVIIKNNVGINKEGLFSTITNLLGFTHMGEKIQQKLNNCLNNLIKNKKVKQEYDEYFLA